MVIPYLAENRGPLLGTPKAQLFGHGESERLQSVLTGVDPTAVLRNVRRIYYTLTIRRPFGANAHGHHHPSLLPEGLRIFLLTSGIPHAILDMYSQLQFQTRPCTLLCPEIWSKRAPEVATSGALLFLHQLREPPNDLINRSIRPPPQGKIDDPIRESQVILEKCCNVALKRIW